jgi:hypothetical protein
MKIEWPAGSGRVADYNPQELALVRNLVARCRRGEITQEQLELELGHFHDAKVELGAELAAEPDDDGDVPDVDDYELEVSAWPEGHVGPEPEKLIRDAFTRFHRENPHVYLELVRMSRQLVAHGHEKIGIGMLFEVLRWRHMLQTTGDTFKLNNNYRSYYARLIMLSEPDLRGVFELRRLHGPGLSTGDSTD